MSDGSLIRAGVVVDREGFINVTHAIRSWVFGANPIFACQYYFLRIEESQRHLAAGSGRDVNSSRFEVELSPQAKSKLEKDMKEISMMLRRSISKPGSPDSIKVYDSTSGLQVHDFINGFDKTHVVRFSELKKWAEERCVAFEKWDEMDRVGTYLRYREIQAGVYLWDAWASMVLPSGLTVKFSDFQFSKGEAHVWQRRFKRYKEFIAGGGVLMEYGSGECAVAPGRRGHISAWRKSAAERGEPASASGAFRRDLSKMFRLISERFGGAAHLPSASISKKPL